MAGAPTTYAELQASIQRWMNDSTTYASVIGEIIALTERRLSRELSSPDMEGSTTLSLTNGTTALPSDFLEMRKAYIVFNNRRYPLEPETEQDFTQAFNEVAVTGAVPTRFNVSAGNFSVRPIADTYPVAITYKQALPALSDANPSNWLLAKWPDLYISASIATAALFGFEDARLPLLSANADALVDEINTTGRKSRYGTGPLVAKPPVGDFGRRSGGYDRVGNIDPALLDSDGEYLVDG